MVVLSTPLTEATRGLADADFLARMKDGALLVNVARGRRRGHRGAAGRTGDAAGCTAALDVTDPEPLPAGHPLWHAPGVLISPHVGGTTSAFLPRAKRLLRAQLTRFAAASRCENVVLTTTAARRAHRRLPAAPAHRRTRSAVARVRAGPRIRRWSSRRVEELCP